MGEQEKPEKMEIVEVRDKDEAATPAGDFIAQVASAVAVIFTFLTFYTNPANEAAVKGYETPYGIIILVAGALSFIFASAVLWAKFLDRDFWLIRSPGWGYNVAAGVIIVVSILAMVFPWKGYDVNWGAPLVELITGVIIGVGGMLKF